MKQNKNKVMKQCRGICKEFKPLDEFYEHVSSRDGHINKCKACVSLHMASYRQTNLEKVKEQCRVSSQKHRDNHPDEFKLLTKLEK